MTKVLLNTINLQAKTQLRETKESQLHIEDLAYIYAEKGEFNELPWVGRINGGDILVPIDGFHRLHAVEWLSSHEYNALSDAPDVSHLDLTMVDVRITSFATLADAIIAAAGVNSSHGLKRNKGDIKNAIEVILDVAPMEFMSSPYKINIDAIVAAVNCSRNSVMQQTKDTRFKLDARRDLIALDLSDEGLSSRQIEERTGINYKLVQRLQAKERHTGTNEHHVHLSQQDTPSDQDELNATVFTHATSVTPIENPFGVRPTFTERKENNTEVVATDGCIGSVVSLFTKLSQQEKDAALLIMNDLVMGF